MSFYFGLLAAVQAVMGLFVPALVLLVAACLFRAGYALTALMAVATYVLIAFILVAAFHGKPGSILWYALIFWRFVARDTNNRAASVPSGKQRIRSAEPCFGQAVVAEEPLEDELRAGQLRRAEIHWYEAHGIGRRDSKRKRYLEEH